MAYDLLVRPNGISEIKPEFVAQFEFKEVASICRLLKRVDSDFLHRIAGYYEDHVFDLAAIDTALSQLFPLITLKLQADEEAMLHKLLAALSFAKWRGLDLHGLAD